MTDLHTLLEENELAFLRRHRSATYDLPFGTLHLSSDASVLPWNFVSRLRVADGEIHSAIETVVAFMSDWARTPCIKVTPMSRPRGWEQRLAAAGWTERARLSHMLLAGEVTGVPQDVHVRACRSAADIRLFSVVQSAGFGASDWVEWVEKVNFANLSDPDQRFYIAEIDSLPVGVCLLVSTGTAAGLYAVATLPDYRKRGVARALIARAAEDSKRMGNELLCLNTATGGPAEEVFRNAGFRHAFESVFYAPVAS